MRKREKKGKANDRRAGVELLKPLLVLFAVAVSLLGLGEARLFARQEAAPAQEVEKKETEQEELSDEFKKLQREHERAKLEAEIAAAKRQAEFAEQGQAEREA